MFQAMRPLLEEWILCINFVPDSHPDGIGVGHLGGVRHLSHPDDYLQIKKQQHMGDTNNGARPTNTQNSFSSFWTSIKPGLKLLANFFEALWASLLNLVSLLWELATQGLKMLLDTLKEIPPMVIGLISATLLCWFGLTLLTSNETIRILFAITLCILALGAMGLAYLQKWFDHKKSLRQVEWERMNADIPTINPVQEQLLALEKLSELLKKIPVEGAENVAKLEDATTKSLLNILDQINLSGVDSDKEASQISLPALPVTQPVSRKAKN